MTRSPISTYLAAIGKKGGEVQGESKRRGDADYYRELAQKSAKARRKSSKKRSK